MQFIFFTLFRLNLISKIFLSLLRFRIEIRNLFSFLIVVKFNLQVDELVLSTNVVQFNHFFKNSRRIFSNEVHSRVIVAENIL